MFNRLVSLVVVLSILSASALYAVDPPAMQWHKGYGTSYGNHVHEGMQTSDGGYIGIGQTWDSYDDYPEMLVIKTYANGNKEWQKVIGTTNQPDIGICIAEVSDGFICGGGLYDSTNMKRALVKLNKTTGNIVSGWPKYYSGSQGCAVRGIDILDDGSIVATGYKNSTEGAGGFVFICDDGDGFIMKTDADGNVVWDKGLSVPQGTKVRQISTGFAICSTDWYFDGGDHQDAVLIKTNSSGNETNKYHFGGTGGEHCYDFDLTSDGGYILGGHTTSYGSVNWDYYLVKVNSNGVEQWHQTFGQPRGYNANYIHDEAYGVRQTPDGGYIIAGGSGDEYSYSACGHPAGCSDEWKAYLVKTDSSGNLLWQDVYPPTSVGNTAGEYLGLTSDGGYIVFTDTDAFWGTVGAEAFGFMKIAPDTPYTPPPTPPTPDMDGSGVANFVDYSLFAAQWMRTDCNDCNGADFTADGNVDYNDLALFVDNWLRDYTLLGYWQLDGDANDSSGYGHDGTVHGGAVWQPTGGKVDGALLFDGLDDCIVIADDGDFDIVDELTITAWIKKAPDNDGYVLMRNAADNSYRYYGIYTRGTADEVRFYYETSGGLANEAWSSITIDDDLWHHLALVVNYPTAQLYIDGQPRSEETMNGNMLSGTANVKIGRRDPDNYYFEGLIDEVRIYDKALNQQEIEALAGV